MSKTLIVVLTLVIGLVLGFAVGSRMTSGVQGQTVSTDTAFSAVPAAIGAEDVSGPYEVAEGWPKDLSTLPGHEKWRGKGHLCRKPGSRLSARGRGIAKCPSSADDTTA